MSAHTIEADKIAAEALQAGHKLWAGIDASGLRNRDEPRVFELLLDTICDERPGSSEENALWHASAMMAIPNAELDGPSRTIIQRKASNTWDAYVRLLERDAEEDVADYRRDVAREERAA